MNSLFLWFCEILPIIAFYYLPTYRRALKKIWLSFLILKSKFWPNVLCWGRCETTVNLIYFHWLRKWDVSGNLWSIYCFVCPGSKMRPSNYISEVFEALEKEMRPEMRPWIQQKEARNAQWCLRGRPCTLCPPNCYLMV